MSVRPPDEARPPSRLRRLDDALVPALQRTATAPGRLLRGLDRWFLGGRPARAVTEHRGVAAFLVVGLMFGAVAVHAQRYPELQRAAREAAGPTTPSGDAGAGGDVAAASDAVGPLASSRVEPYLDARQDALATAAADAERPAVVSFTEFLDPGQADDLVDGLDVVAVQYRLPERTPRPDELAVGDEGLVTTVQRHVADLVSELRAEEAEVASTLESGVEDDAFRADYEARLDELGALRNTLSSDPAIVFAVVVDGATVGQLRDVAGRDGVRLVDLGPGDGEVADLTFHGVLPTDTDRFSYGRGV